MRFESISIPAYGRFENMVLQLPAASHDLQVIYGPNEAGKSTLLRAIRGLLFGIEVKTKDNFLHDHEALRIGAEISAGPERVLKFYRRKGNKNTLLDVDKKPLPDDALAPFLGVVDADYFSTMFGMGSEELRERGRAVLAGKDSLGKVLFSASMGGTPVEKVIASLREEAERLFKGRATTNVTLRPALRAYDDLMRASKESIIKPDDWAALEAEWQAAIQRKLVMSEALAALRTRHEWLTRCNDALPTIALLDEAEQQWSALAEVPELSAATVAQARATLDQQRAATADAARLAAEVARLTQARDASTVRADVLADAAEIERLHLALGIYKQHRKSLPALQAEVAALEQELRAGMREFELTGDVADIEALRLPKAAEAAQKLAARQLTSARSALESGRGKYADVEAALAAQQRQLAALAVEGVAALRSALAETEGVAEVLRAVPELETRLRKEERAVAAAHALLHSAPGDYATTYGLAVPAKTTLRRHQVELVAVLDAHREATRAVATAGEAQRSALDALAMLQRGRHIPSLDELVAARAARDAAWRAVLASIEGMAARGDSGSPAPQAAFVDNLREADSIADALREHAQAVADAERHRGDAERAQRDLADGQARHDKTRADHVAWQSRWVAVWQSCGLDIAAHDATPMPAEMEEWRDHWMAFREAYDACQYCGEQLAGHRVRIASAEALLRGVVPLQSDLQSEPQSTDGAKAKPRAGLATLLAEAKKRVQTADELAGQRKALQRSIDDLSSKREALLAEQAAQDKSCATAMAAWAQQCAMLGFAPDTAPEMGLELAAGRARLIESAARYTMLRRELVGAQLAVQTFEKEARAAGDALGLPAAPAEAQEAALWQALANARSAKARYDEYEAQLELNAQALATARGTEAVANTALLAAQQLARADGLEQLPAALEAIANKTALHDHAQMLRTTLRGQARGTRIEDFITQVRAEEAVTLGTRLAACLGEIAEQTEQLASAQEGVRVLEQRKLGYEQAADDAANYRQLAESKAALVVNDAARYMRLQLAIHLLEQQIETFRKANQGPLLKRSGEIFSRFTRSSFIGLDVVFDADDEPLLTGLRADGKMVRVEGMSEGTRDQLYLALRFAGLERHLANHAPMPLILDDLLITFDDDRAAAILPALAELSQRTQVLLFTHHQHLVELCARVLPGQCALHELK